MKHTLLGLGFVAALAACSTTSSSKPPTDNSPSVTVTLGANPVNLKSATFAVA